MGLNPSHTWLGEGASIWGEVSEPPNMDKGELKLCAGSELALLKFVLMV